MSVAGRADFNFIRYSNCWEDPAVLIESLELRPGGDYLSITSAGDNMLALLTGDPGRVVAVDLSRDQTALAMLKSASFRGLNHGEMLRFLGFHPETSEIRLEMYREVSRHLPIDVRQYWDTRDNAVISGVIHLGRFERYFQIFRTRILPLIHSRRTVESLLAPRDRSDRDDFYQNRWDTFRWRMLFAVFFSRRVMGRLGRDPEFFRHVDGSVASRILSRTEYALTALPVADNPYVRYILTGSFGDVLPDYAQAKNFDRIVCNLEAVEFRTGDILSATGDQDRFDGMNLSDIFEYMTPAEAAELGVRLSNRLRPGGRMVYWEMLADRDIAAMLPKRFERIDDLSDDLHQRDRAFFYQKLHVLERSEIQEVEQ